MKYLFIILFCCHSLFIFGQDQKNDTTKVFKKRVLEAAEIDLLMSMYNQEGVHSAVNGGIGSEKLSDYTPTLVVSIPLGDDGVLSVDAGISAYSSASSSNINPFYNQPIKATNSGGGIITNSGASQRGAANLINRGTDTEDDDDQPLNSGGKPIGTPWYASSGASKSDALTSINVSYSNSSDDRNKITSVNVSGSKEYDYASVGMGLGFTRFFNQQNTEVSIKGSVYLDNWSVIYPTELREYRKYGTSFLNSGYFTGVEVYDEAQNVSINEYNPTSFSSVPTSKRNTFSVSLGFSQILSRNLQVSIFLDVVRQEGLLSTPYQRVYFADRQNYYIGQSEDISYYESSQNNGVFHLADDIERLPDSRFKIPIGLRLNYYLNEVITFRTYYRYYEDNWGLSAHTASIEMPVKLSQKFTVYPSYRYYIQDQADYFAPYDTHLSSEQYYTSDYDLSTFDSKSVGFGIRYTDIFTKMKLYKLGLKKVDLRYQSYNRSDGLKSNIISLGVSFVVDN